MAIKDTYSVENRIHGRKEPLRENGLDRTPAIFAALFFGVLLALNWTGDQDWGGDWAVYVVQAQNLLDLKFWGDGLERYASGPVQAIFLAPFIGIFGLNFYAISVANTILLAIAYFVMLRQVANCSWILAALFAIFISNIDQFQHASIQAIPSALTIFLTVVTVLSPLHLHQTRRVSAALLTLQRLEGFIAPLTFIVTTYRHRKRIVLITTLLTGVLAYWFWLLPLLFTGGPVGTSGSLRSFLSKALQPQNLPSLFEDFSKSLRDNLKGAFNDILTSFGLQGASAQGLMLVGIIGGWLLLSERPGPWRTAARFCVAHSLFMALVGVVFQSEPGEMPLRYMNPVVFVTFGMVMHTLSVAVTKSRPSLLSKTRALGNTKWQAITINFSLALIASLFILDGDRSVSNSHRFYYENNLPEVVGATPNDVSLVGFVKPRTAFMAYRLDRPEAGVQTVVVRSGEGAADVLDSGGCVITVDTVAYNQAAVSTTTRAIIESGLAEEIYRNDTFSLICGST